MIRRIAREAERMFNKHGELPMIWLVNAPDEEFMMITEVEETGAAKYDLTVRVREFFREHNVTRYARAYEAWISPDGQVRPRRIERVMIDGEDSDQYLYAFRDIVRPATGKPYLTPLSKIERPAQLGSRFVGLLPKDGVI
jgi:hypothetical protein